MSANTETEDYTEMEKLGYWNGIDRQIFKAKTPPATSSELDFQYVWNVSFFMLETSRQLWYYVMQIATHLDRDGVGTWLKCVGSRS